MPPPEAMLIDGHHDRTQKGTEWHCNGLKLLIEGIVEYRSVHVPHQVNEAALLQALETVVSGIEVRDQDAFEVLEHLPQKLAFPGRAKDIDGALDIGEHPDVARTIAQLHLGFVDIEHWPGNDFRQERSIGVPIIPGEQMPKDKKLGPAHSNPEGFVEERGKSFYTKSMRNLLVGKPAHETVKVRRHSMILVRDEAMFALRTPISCGSNIDYLPFDCPWRDDDIVRSFPPRLGALRPPLRGKRNKLFALT
jgi:hypothetical protein